jgi:hypothetical protein
MKEFFSFSVSFFILERPLPLAERFVDFGSGVSTALSLLLLLMIDFLVVIFLAGNKILTICEFPHDPLVAAESIVNG